MSKTEISAFKWVPPFAQGLVRDLRVRWALEEAGRSYQEQLISREDQQSEKYRRQQPFGQVPVFTEDGLVLFESGAIVMHIAEQCEVLLPADPNNRARAKTWMFAALDTIEPPIMMLNVIDLQSSEKLPATQDLRGKVVAMIRTRLESLKAALADREYLVADRFTAADLLMTSVLRILRTTDILQGIPALDAYKSRCEARPAFQQALAAQLTAFANHAPQPNR